MASGVRNQRKTTTYFSGILNAEGTEGAEKKRASRDRDALWKKPKKIYRAAATGALTGVSQPWQSGLAPLVRAKNSS